MSTHTMESLDARRKVQAKLRQLDGDFRLQPFLPDAVENFHVVLRDLLRFRAIADVFAEVRENRSNLLAPQSLCGNERVV
jgi:hypothetical protein